MNFPYGTFRKTLYTLYTLYVASPQRFEIGPGGDISRVWYPGVAQP